MKLFEELVDGSKRADRQVELPSVLDTGRFSRIPYAFIARAANPPFVEAAPLVSSFPGDLWLVDETYIRSPAAGGTCIGHLPADVPVSQRVAVAFTELCAIQATSLRARTLLARSHAIAPRLGSATCWAIGRKRQSDVRTTTEMPAPVAAASLPYYGRGVLARSAAASEQRR